MKKVKIFYDGEAEVNNWLEQATAIKILDIQLSAYGDRESSWATVMIVYETTTP